MVVAFGAPSAWAEPSTYCVKATKVLTPKKHFTGGFNDKGCTSVNGTHEGKFEKLASFTAPEEAQLKALLKYMTVQSSGVGGQPTVKLTGANLQVASGPKEAETNGTGNVVIGTDELPGTQTGSNNLVLGIHQEFTSYGGILASQLNSITAPFGSVLGGERNKASGEGAAVNGGLQNKASGQGSSVSGGANNIASSEAASVSGGGQNEATNTQAAVSGGQLNVASGLSASVTGGFVNEASGSRASVTGGSVNVATAEAAGVSGGEESRAAGYGSWIGGGYKNEVFSKGVGEEGIFASIFGGNKEKTALNFAAIP
jgi:hypothetical protein